jgi:hypothetical protein
MRSRKVSGPAGGGPPVPSEMGAAAALHGRELMQQGFTVGLGFFAHEMGNLTHTATLAFTANMIPWRSI